jgi:hypothetical protein
MRSDEPFEMRLVAVAPGRTRAYDEAEWRGALVIVERGQIELESLSGGCRTFYRGDVLWLVGLPLRALHNRGPEPTLLVAVTRAAMSFPPPLGLIQEPRR